jgi:RNA polymerase sigma-70 factor (ECF subfamily)
LLEVMALADRPPHPSSAEPPVDDSFLLGRARHGDLSAFEEVVRRHRGRVYGVALRIVRCHETAEDVAQEAFVRAWRGLERFELGRPFAPWVCRIAANLALNHVRSPRMREQALPEGYDEQRAPDAGPLETVLDAEAKRVLDDAVGALPVEQRAVLVLRVFEELSYDEIAQALQLSPGTVMSRLFRARERLARALAPYLGAAAVRRKGGAA